MNNEILVTGATGKQGGAVVRSLLKRGVPVRALVRDVQKPSARELDNLGAKLFAGSFDDAHALRTAMQGVHGVFSVQNFFEVGYEKEIEQGKRIAKTAEEVGVSHLVFGSVIGADRNSGIPHFDSKWQIEQYIRSLKLKTTSLRLVAYMDNLFTYNWYSDGKLYLPLHETSQWQLIGTADIGEFAAIAFEKPEAVGEVLEIAGDQITPLHLAQIFSKVLDRKVVFQEQPMSELRAYSEELALMFTWFNEKANFADIAAIRKIHPGLMNVEQWLRAEVKQMQPTGK